MLRGTPLNLSCCGAENAGICRSSSQSVQGESKVSFPGLGAIADELRKSTVQILATDERSSGSGIVVGSGLALTNAHVAQDWTVHARNWNGELLRGTVQRRDPRRDL